MEFLSAALPLARMGFRVHPLKPNSKIALLTDWPAKATRDERILRGWAKRYPSANPAILMGDGLIGIDVDLYKGADADWLQLPPTLTAITASGGLHHIYRYAGELPILNEGILAPHVCVKAGVDGKRSYLVGAGSEINGESYVWVDESQPIVDMPERLAHLIRTAAAPKLVDVNQEAPPLRPVKHTDKQDTGAKFLADAMAKTGDGVGDDIGYWLAQQLIIAQKNGDPVDVDGVLSEYAWRATINPADPFDERSVQRWKRSAGGSDVVARGERAKSRSVQKRRESITDNSQPKTDGSSALAPEPPMSEQEMLLLGEADDNGNAETMWRLFGHEFLFTPAIGWLEWTGTHWRETPEPIVAQKAITTLKKRRLAAVNAGAENIIKTSKADNARLTGCLRYFKSYIIEPDVGAFDADPDLLNCQNGVLDLRTGKLTPHSPKQRFTYCLSTPWTPDADMAPWKSFIFDALGGDQATAEYIQLCAGYSLTGHTRAEKMFYLYGPTRAGKGTFTETLLHLLPRPLSSEVDFASFTAKRDNDSQNFDLAHLKPARFLVASESNRSQSLNTAKIKQLTGGNLIYCAFKHKDMFHYRPQFKVWLVSNWEVKADADDDAMWGRVQVFTFPNSHLGKEDTALKDRMKSAMNLRGVLRWAVEGAMRWYEAGLEEPEAIKAATEAQRDGQDYVRQWIDDCCVLDSASWAPYGALRQSYVAWCKANEIDARRTNDFVDTLVKRFHCVAKRQAGTGTRGYQGIGVSVTA